MNDNIIGNPKDIVISSIKHDVQIEEKNLDVVNHKWSKTTKNVPKYYLLIKIPGNNFEIEINGSILDGKGKYSYLKNKIESLNFENQEDKSYNYIFSCNPEDEYNIKILLYLEKKKIFT